MAIYDLKCNECGNEFEKFVTGFLKDSDKECPDCNSRDVVQVFTSFGIGSCGSGGGGSYGGGCAPAGSPFG